MVSVSINVEDAMYAEYAWVRLKRLTASRRVDNQSAVTISIVSSTALKGETTKTWPELGALGNGLDFQPSLRCGSGRAGLPQLF